MSKLFSEEQKQFIFDNYKGRHNQELTDMVNKEFGTHYTLKQIKGFKANHKLNSGLTGRFEKGCVPVNKGKRLSAEHYAKAQGTMFKKGHIPGNILPIGTEVTDAYGYTRVKINNVPKAKKEVNWKLKHHIAYEEAYGKIPEGMYVIFLDGDKQNFNADNLACVSKSEMMIMQTKGFFRGEKEITRSGVYTAKLIAKTIERSKGKDGKETSEQ